MRIFSCPACGATAFFSNMTCACGAELMFDPAQQGFAVNAPACANRTEIRCNWAADPDCAGFCRSCAMTKVIPDAFRGDNRMLWTSAEASKRWVLATLARWGWFIAADPGPSPVFHLLSEDTASGPAKVVMGHAAGVVTINLAEADPVEEVRRREALSERLRTMTVHFRHEIAHFLFERLSQSRPNFQDDFRAIFGDERQDYDAALSRHYANGPPTDWQTRFITPYASAHAHEDWAETAAHVMHLTDMLDSAVAAKLLLPPLDNLDYDAYAEQQPDALIEAAAAYGIALNHVNRAMGHNDIYPFVHPVPVRAKLVAAHGWLSGFAV
jgi:hypothetical protein